MIFVTPQTYRTTELHLLDNTEAVIKSYPTVMFVFGATAPPPVDQSLFIHEVSRSKNDDALESSGLLWTSDQPVAQTCT